MTGAMIRAKAERLVWETEAVLSKTWILLYDGNRAAKASEYSYAKHGPTAHCLNCRRATPLCSWDVEREAVGDCCDRCHHGSVTQ
jgi:hypothetical protein